MENLNIKLLLNAIAAEDPVLAPGDDPAAGPRGGSGLESSEADRIYNELISILNDQYPGGQAAAMFGGFLAFFKESKEAKAIRCLKAFLKFFRDPATVALMQFYIGGLGSGEPLISASNFNNLRKLLNQLFKHLDKNDCNDWRKNPEKLVDAIRRLQNLSKEAADYLVDQIKNGVKNITTILGEVAAITNDALAKQYAAIIAAEEAGIGSEGSDCQQGGTNWTLIIVLIAAIITAIVTYGVGSPWVAATIASLGTLGVCGSLSADQIEQIGVRAERLYQEYKNPVSVDEAYIDEVLDPSGLSDLGNYPGSGG